MRLVMLFSYSRQLLVRTAMGQEFKKSVPKNSTILEFLKHTYRVCLRNSMEDTLMVYILSVGFSRSLL